MACTPAERGCGCTAGCRGGSEWRLGCAVPTPTAGDDHAGAGSSDTIPHSEASCHGSTNAQARAAGAGRGAVLERGLDGCLGSPISCILLSLLGSMVWHCFVVETHALDHCIPRIPVPIETIDDCIRQNHVLGIGNQPKLSHVSDYGLGSGLAS